MADSPNLQYESSNENNKGASDQSLNLQKVFKLEKAETETSSPSNSTKPTSILKQASFEELEPDDLLIKLSILRTSVEHRFPTTAQKIAETISSTADETIDSIGLVNLFNRLIFSRSTSKLSFINTSFY